MYIAIIGILVILFIRMLTVNSEPLTDYDLYGMDAAEYERIQMGYTPDEFETYLNDADPDRKFTDWIHPDKH